MLTRRASCPKLAALIHALLAMLLLIAVLLSGCGVTSIFNGPAPVSSDIIVPYSGDVANTTTAGITGLHVRDGNTAWHIKTSAPSTQFAPILVKGILLTEGGTLEPPAGTLLAARVSDGHILWQKSLPIRDVAIATDGTIVLVAAKSAELYALDVATGAQRWHLDGDFTTPLAVGHGLAIATHVTIQGDQAYLAIYQEDNGKPLRKFTYAPPVSVNSMAVYTDYANEVLAYAPRTGKELWHREIAGSVIATTEQTVILSDQSNVIGLDPATGRTLWTTAAMLDTWSGVTHTATAVYGAHQNAVIALRMSDGGQLWQQTFDGYTVTQLTQEQGIIFALLAGAPESSTPARVAAIDAMRGNIYWERDIQAIAFLADSVG